MKLLFDQNLSPSLVESLADIYPESVHVQSVGLDRADDTAVWDFRVADFSSGMLQILVYLCHGNQATSIQRKFVGSAQRVLR